MTRNNSFTLVELLVVIGIIAVLAAMLMPALTKAQRAARQTECVNQMKQISVAYEMYRNDNRNNFPCWSSNLYPEYIETKKIFHCPMDYHDYRQPHYDRQFQASFDLPENHGLTMNPTDVGGMSYFYELSDASCNYSLPGKVVKDKNGNPKNPYSWCEMKEVQIEDYDPTLFPVLRCFFHHVGKRGALGQESRPCLNISYAGNYFMSKFYWEDGAWTP